MSRTVLVTGAAGFIGFHTAQLLHARGDRVVGFDNFNNYYSTQLKRDRQKFLEERAIHLVEGDICNQAALKNLFAAHSFTHVIHLAAQAGVRYSTVNPHAYTTANLEGFLNILECCRHSPATRLIYASSSSVYGLNSKIPFSITDPTERPASLYGATKKANELMAHAYHHMYGIPVVGLRFFTVYGPWGRPDMAYFSFTKAIIEETPIQLYNRGEMQRDFTFIDDVTAGILAALDAPIAYGIFNLGNHRPETLRRFVQILETAIGKRAILQPAPMQIGDVLTTYAEIEESRKQLGFNPQTPLEEGLPRFVAWYKNYFSVEKTR